MDQTAATPIPATPATPPSSSPGSSRHIDRSLVHGIAWTGAMKWGTQILSWASTLVVANLLEPGDYGLMGMALVYTQFVHLVNEFGLGAAIIQNRNLSDDQIGRIGGLSLLNGVFFCLVSVALSPLIARFFGEHAVQWIVMALSTTFVLSAFQIMPRSLLSRDMQFQRVAWIDGTEALVGVSATLILAYLGLRYWSLVLGQIGGSLAATTVALIWGRHRYAWPKRFRSIAGAVNFGWHIVAARIAWFVYSNADFTIVGRVLGKVALGAYTFGWTIASIPVDRVAALVASVTPAVFSAVQHDPPAIRRYLRALTEGLSLITFPASLGIFLVADQFVGVALHADWQPAIMPLRLLAIYGGFRSVVTLMAQVLVATGRSKLNMQFNILAALLLPAMFYIGTNWGTSGVAIAWIIGYPLIVIPTSLRSALRSIGMTYREYFLALWPATNCTILMGVAVVALRLVLPTPAPGRGPLMLQFGLTILWGAAVYAAVLYFLHGERVRGFIRIVKDLRK